MIPFGDIGSYVESVLGGPLTGTRYEAGTKVEGDWVPGDSEALTFVGSAQPSTAAEILSLPEGERTKEAITVYSTFLLRTSDVATQTQSDTVNWAGRVWKVMVVEPWIDQANYMRAVAVRIGE